MGKIEIVIPGYDGKAAAEISNAVGKRLLEGMGQVKSECPTWERLLAEEVTSTGVKEII